MNLRDLLTLLGTIVTALGAQLHLHGTTSTAFWIAVVCDTVGPILVGARAVLKAPDGVTPPSGPTGTRKMLPLLAVFLGLSALSVLTACAGIKSAWGTPDARKATVAKLEGVAVNVLGRIAVAELQSLATDNGADFAHSAAQAAWSSLHVSDLADVLTAAGATPQLADSAATLAAKAVAGGASKQDAMNAVASAISASALK